MKAAMFFLAALLCAQQLPPVSQATDYAHLHNGLAPPSLLHAEPPAYTAQGLKAGIEGTAVIEAVISKEGQVAYASILSPLPAGLDRKALEVVKSWRYAPALMDGEKVPVRTTIDVVFRLPLTLHDQLYSPQQEELHRILNTQSLSSVQLADLKTFASTGNIAALALLGRLKVQGDSLEKDVAGGMADLRRAANAQNAFALSFLGRAELEGTLMPKDEANGWLLIRRAAFMGDIEAEKMIAAKCERDKNLDQARWYYRLCAARADAACEYELGRLIVTGDSFTPDYFTQGVAWLELSSDHHYAAAAALWQSSRAKLGSIQYEWLANLKPHLELPGFKSF